MQDQAEQVRRAPRESAPNRRGGTLQRSGGKAADAAARHLRGVMQ
jgi:hypothetical protein